MAAPGTEPTRRPGPTRTSPPSAPLGLLVAVEAGTLDGLLAIEAAHLRGQIAFDQERGGDAARLF
jgi:hypothetical protein